jgi:putative tricarboxylic transport membrane protein
MTTHRRMTRRSWNDVLFGLVLVATGTTGIALASDLPFGNAMRMGPGYVPTLLGWLTVVFGFVSVLKGAIVAGPALAAWSLRPLLAVTVAIGLFMEVDRLGLVVTVAGVTLIASCGEPGVRWAQAARLALVLAVFASLVFVFALGLPFSLWPTMLWR